MKRFSLLHRWALLTAAYVALTVLSFGAVWRASRETVTDTRIQAARFVGELVNGESEEEIRAKVAGLVQARERSRGVFGLKLWIVDANDRVVAASSTEPVPKESIPTGLGTAVIRLKMSSESPYFIVLEQLSEKSFLMRGTSVVIWVLLWVICGSALLGSFTWATMARQRDRLAQLTARLQASELSRRKLLQEVGHDLRTPLATLQLLFDRLNDYHGQMTEAQRGADIQNALHDLDYLKRLVGFLFTLSDANEPSYRVDFCGLNLAELVAEEVAARSGSPVRFRLAPGSLTEAPIDGDRNLLGRMFRNALDNAAKFAVNEVAVNLRSDGPRIELTITDDGPGPSEAALSTFGQRPASPDFESAFDLSQSVGLGSTIIRAIAELHGGTATLGRGDGRRGGRLIITLRRADAVPAAA